MHLPPPLFADDHKIAVIIKLANATTLDQSAAVHPVTNETAPMNKNALPATMVPDKGKSTVTHSLGRRSPNMIRFAAAAARSMA